jgi:large subunit ribosomal protein L19e
MKSRMEEIKEAITKQDIKDLQKEGAIVIKEKKGRRKKEKRKKKRTGGKIKKKVYRRKKEYVTMSRKLRKHVAEMKKNGELQKEEIADIRKKIRNREFKSLANLKKYIKESGK